MEPVSSQEARVCKIEPGAVWGGVPGGFPFLLREHSGSGFGLASFGLLRHYFAEWNSRVARLRFEQHLQLSTSPQS